MASKNVVEMTKLLICILLSVGESTSECLTISSRIFNNSNGVSPSSVQSKESIVFYNPMDFVSILVLDCAAH